MTRRTLGALPLAALVMIAPVLRAQAWRTLESSRQLHDSTARMIQVQYGAGRLDLRRSREALLYRMHLKYDAEQTEPLHAYDSGSRTLRVGISDRNVSMGGKDDAGRMDLALTSIVPLSLDLKLGAVEADLDLTGLAISSLRVRSGASDARIRFDSLNAQRMGTLEIEMGAAQVRATSLANANADTIRVGAGVGGVELDFGGAWRGDIALFLRLALGGATLRVPDDVGIRVDLQRFVVSFEHDDLVKRDDGAWYSRNWDTARHHLRVNAQTTFGKLRIERSPR